MTDTVGTVTALHGLGGMGKTALAATYARHFGHEYQGGTWHVEADGHTDILDALSSLALSPELGLEVTPADLADRQWLGRRVLARLGHITAAARATDPETASCLILLDNVSEGGLLAKNQLAILPAEPWLDVIATTRLGLSDFGLVQSRASVAMLDVGPLERRDALEMLRQHQNGQEFASTGEEDAAREIVDLLDGYTLAVEQAAVYLGSTDQASPSILLALLQDQGTALLDQVGASAAMAGNIEHREKLTGLIVDGTVGRLPDRAREALAFASLLPPETIPWAWLEQLTGGTGTEPSGLPGLHLEGDWASTRRVLEGRRLIVQGDDPRLGRLHRVLGEHLRSTLDRPGIEPALDDHLDAVSQAFESQSVPDTFGLTTVAVAITTRLLAGRRSLAQAGLGLAANARHRVDPSVSLALAAATHSALEHVATADDVDNQRDLADGLIDLGRLVAERGDRSTALSHFSRALRIRRRSAASGDRECLRELSEVLNEVATVLASQGNPAEAMEHLGEALSLAQRLVENDPTDTYAQEMLVIDLQLVGDVAESMGDAREAMRHFERALAISESLSAAHRDRYDTLLAFSLDRTAKLHRDEGRLTDALAQYDRTLSIRLRLSENDPAHAGHQRQIMFSLSRLAGVHLLNRDLQAAHEHYAHGLSIAERLAAAAPTNVDRQYDLAIGHTKMADVLSARGLNVDALAHYQRAVTLGERLMVSDATHVDRLRQLIFSLRRAGEMLTACGDHATAVERLTRGVELSDDDRRVRLVRDDDRAELAVTLHHLGQSLTAEGRFTAALASYTRSIEGWKRLQRNQDAAATLRAMGETYTMMDDAASALECFAQASDIRDRLLSDDPSNRQARSELAVVLLNTGDALQGLDRADEAADRYARALEICERLAQENPDDDEDQRRLAYCLDKVGDNLFVARQHTDAMMRYERALHVRQALLVTDPTPGARRDVYVSGWKIAQTAESLGHPSAREHWATTYRAMADLDATDDLLDADRRYYDEVRTKLGLV